jgi:hypothetical protein
VERRDGEHLVRNILYGLLLERRQFLLGRRDDEVPTAHRLYVPLLELSEARRVAASFLIVPPKFARRFSVARFLGDDALERVARRTGRRTGTRNPDADGDTTAATAAIATAAIATAAIATAISVSATVAVPLATSQRERSHTARCLQHIPSANRSHTFYHRCG